MIEQNNINDIIIIKQSYQGVTMVSFKIKLI